MTLAADLRVLFHLAKPVRGDTHEQRLENFYAGQAGHYDQFRRRLLHGREEMYRSLPLTEGADWVDMGGGTGANLNCVAEKITELRSATIVDLSPSLLRIAQDRITARRWKNVHAVEADATSWLPDHPVDVVTFSYSLTMMPDPLAAIDHAISILKPGGTIGVVDFYVSAKFPRQDMQKHSAWTRHFWPLWFGMDNVFLTPHLLSYLQRKLSVVSLHESAGRVPYVPLGKVPYFRFVGLKEE